MLGSLNPAEEYFTDPRAQWLTVVGRRKLNYSIQQVQQELASIARLADEEVPGRVTSLTVTNGSLVQDPETGSKLPLIFAMTLGTTALLLLLACMNASTLLLSRSTTRQHEIAVRLSLGAGRGRIIRQLFTESLIMSGLATVFSFLVALRGPAALWALLMSSSAPFDLSPDWRIWLYCLCVALATGIIAGLSPALEMLRPKIAESLKGSSTATTPGHRKSKLRSLLVATQISLSLLLLVQFGLLTRAQRQFISYEPGFETKRVLSVMLSSVSSGFNPPLSFYRQLELRVKAVPGVVNTSFASAAPWSGRHSTAVLEIDGISIPATGNISRQDPAQRAVSPEYFSVLNIEMISGRAFRAGEHSSDRQGMPTVISEAMALRYWPGQDPVGHHFRTSVVHEVVGVCRDVQSVRYLQDDGPFYYTPFNLQDSKPPLMLIRVSGNTELVATASREIIRQLDPQMACTTATLTSLIDGYAERLKPFVTCGVIAGSLALCLALTGIYGVVSLSVSLRIREIGIRMALGAQRRDIVCLVLRSGAVPVFGGLIIGIILAAVASTGTKAVLFGFNPHDPMTFIIVSMLLLFTALTAIGIPACRAARTLILKVLRQE
jgi:predicted permease